MLILLKNRLYFDICVDIQGVDGLPNKIDMFRVCNTSVWLPGYI